jgi:hypothetical protein
LESFHFGGEPVNCFKPINPIASFQYHPKISQTNLVSKWGVSAFPVMWLKLYNKPSPSKSPFFLGGIPTIKNGVVNMAFF